MAATGTSGRVRLGYWDIRGLAQPIRFLLEVSKVAYDEKRYEILKKGENEWDASQWTDEKFKLGLTFPNLPWLEDGELKLTQSNAIIRHICRKYNPDLLGKNEADMSVVDMLMDVIGDYRSGIVTLSYKDTANFEANKATWTAGAMKPNLDSFSKYLGDKSYLVGYITAADFLLYEMLDQTRLMVSTSLQPYPNLKAFLDNFEAQPAVKEYMSSKRYISRPINNKMAAFK